MLTTIAPAGKSVPLTQLDPAKSLSSPKFTRFSPFEHHHKPDPVTVLSIFFAANNKNTAFFFSPLSLAATCPGA
jgi:hypothetical protein